MRFFSLAPAVALLCGAWTGGAAAASGGKALSGSTIVVSDTLNVTAMRREYTEGNFESLTQALETFRSRGPIRRRDSLAVAKYLGVIYAADPATREKGKYWLYKMLEMDPEAGIVELFVSEEIHSTLERARQELNLQKRAQGTGKDTARVSAPPDAPSAKPEAAGIADRRWTWNLNVVLVKKTTAAAWKPLKEQSGVNLDFDLRRRSWPVGIFLNVMGTGFSDTNNVRFKEVSTVEFCGGVRKTWDRKFRVFRPYVGAGLAYVAAEVDTGAVTVWRRSRAGLRTECGMRWELWRHFNLGFEVSYTLSRATFKGIGVNPGGGFGGFLLGYHY